MLLQKLTAQRCLLYEFYDYLITQKETSLEERERERERDPLNAAHTITIDIELMLWEELLGYLAKNNLQHYLPPYCYRGEYARLLHWIKTVGEAHVKEQIDHFIIDLWNYLDQRLANLKENTSQLPCSHIQYITIERNALKRAKETLIQSIKAAKVVHNLFPTFNKITSTALPAIIDIKISKSSYSCKTVSA